MPDSSTRVFLVKDDLSAPKPSEEALVAADAGEFRVRSVPRLSDALVRLRHNAFAVILLDLALPGGRGLEVLEQVRAAAQNAGVLILSSAGDEELAGQAVQRGAPDYIVTSRFSGHWLARVLRYMVDRKSSGDALRVSEARLRAVGDTLAVGIVVSDPKGRCVYTNAAYRTLSGLTFAQTLNADWRTAIHPEDSQRVLAQWRDAARSPDPIQSEYRFMRNDGSVVWTRVNRIAMFDGTELCGHVQTFDDITAWKQAESGARAAEEALIEEKERAQTTLDLIGDAVLMTDLQANLTYLNPVAQKMTGWTCEDAQGRPLAEVFNIVDGNTRQLAASPAQRAMDTNEAVSPAADCLLIRRDGFESAIEQSAAPLHDRDRRVSGAVIVFHDVIQSREMEHHIYHLAHHDPLTGLPNRVLLTERLSRAMALARRHGKKVGLMYLDLDRFKRVNDSLGHAVGDELLRSVATHLSACVRDTDTVCRQGGDEFVILLTEIEQPQDAAQVADTLCAQSAPPHIVAGHELPVTFSVGVSIYPDDGMDVDTLIKNADTAMYQVKANGRGHYRFYREDMNTAALRRDAVREKLPRALREREFVLHYQPKINLDTGVISGLEALIRWQDPEVGIVYPEQFVPIAEECGLITPIGLWVMRKVCRQIQAWLHAGRAAVPVSINISAEQFRDKDFPESVAMVLKETGVPARYLELEISESMLMEDANTSVSALEALRAHGVRLALGNFGTGGSTGSLLKRFPVDTLKIDRTLIRDLFIDADDAEIVESVIGIAKELQHHVVAEGIETRAQLTRLRELGCDTGQGFYFSRPWHGDVCENLMDVKYALAPPVTASRPA